MKKFISYTFTAVAILFLNSAGGLLLFEDNRDIMWGLLFLGISILLFASLWRFGKF